MFLHAQEAYNQCRMMLFLSRAFGQGHMLPQSLISQGFAAVIPTKTNKPQPLTEVQLVIWEPHVRSRCRDGRAPTTLARQAAKINLHGWVASWNILQDRAFRCPKAPLPRHEAICDAQHAQCDRHRFPCCNWNPYPDSGRNILCYYVRVLIAAAHTPVSESWLAWECVGVPYMSIIMT